MEMDGTITMSNTVDAAAADAAAATVPRTEKRKNIDLSRQLHQENVRQFLGLNVQATDRQLAIQRFTSELVKRKSERKVIRDVQQKEKALSNIEEVFD